jgi:hypothetical protein
MHPQIQKLAQEAGLYVDVNGKPWPRNMNGEDIEGAYQKFAELVIQECATVVERNLFQGIGWNTSRAVKQHFGIEIEE